jgi:hypothetical protein
VPASDDLRAIRGKAIGGLLELFDQSTSPVEQRKIFSALMVATYLPIRANCSSDLYWTVLGDTKRIVDGLSERVAGKPYDLLEHIEHEFLRHYNIARQVAEDEQDKFSCKDIAEDLTKSILAFRDSLNADKQFVRYKTLVGFESVFPPHWETTISTLRKRGVSNSGESCLGTFTRRSKVTIRLPRGNVPCRF